MTEVLTQMYKDRRYREAFAATLPMAGQDGTISSRLKRTRAEGNALARSRLMWAFRQAEAASERFVRWSSFEQREWVT